MNGIKKLRNLFALLVLTCLMFSSMNEISKVSAEESTTTASWYSEMIQNGLLSKGTNGRLEKVITRLHQGEDVTVAAIGGSITEGASAVTIEESYADCFVTGLRNRYPNSNISYINAGFSGTPSSLGNIRYERDITYVLQGDPDLVVVEFAVNDSKELTEGRCLDSLVQTILNKPSEPAVILLFSVTQGLWNNEDIHVPVGEKYGTPMVSIKNSVKPYIEQGLLDSDAYFGDFWHPKSLGHRIMADNLLYLIDVVEREPEIIEGNSVSDIPLADFPNMHMITAAGEFYDCRTSMGNAAVQANSFDSHDTELQTSRRAQYGEFYDNWMHTPSSGNLPFQVSLYCNKLILNYKTSTSESFGDAEVYIDGEKVAQLSGYDEDAWNSSNLELLIDEEESSVHLLEIKMAEGNEDKYFTIQCLGYSY